MLSFENKSEKMLSSPKMHRFFAACGNLRRLHRSTLMLGETIARSERKLLVDCVWELGLLRGFSLCRSRLRAFLHYPWVLLILRGIVCQLHGACSPSRQSSCFGPSTAGHLKSLHFSFSLRFSRSPTADLGAISDKIPDWSGNRQLGCQYGTSAVT